MNYILGISAFYHDSAAVLLADGNIVAAAQEERFSRVKNDASFPVNAIKYVLNEGGIDLEELDIVSFYEKPFLKFERLLETYHAFAPKGVVSFVKSMPVWMKEKLFQKKMITDELKKLGTLNAQLVFPEHHLSHAASAFFPSPFEESAILTIDGVGEWATTTLCHGLKNEITVLKELHFPHSLGLLYSAFTYYCGFRVNSGEYKLMGLAPYGDPDCKQTEVFIKKIKEELVDIREDGSFLLNQRYFEYATGLKMTNDKRWQNLFGIKRRVPESEISQDYMNLAYAIQKVSEEIILKLAETARILVGSENLVLAGGVALNSVANGKILESGLFKNVWVQPAAGDAGGALGAAVAAWHVFLGEQRHPSPDDSMKAALLGPSFSEKEIQKFIRSKEIQSTHFEDFDVLCNEVASFIEEGKVVGWFQGRMEYGPRALGNRSILADARNSGMQRKLNLKIKYRESFRPFAPSVLEEDAGIFFHAKKSPYMLFVVPVRDDLRIFSPISSQNNIMERLNMKRSEVPAVTHVDYSARVQTVSKGQNLKFWKLLQAFKEKSGTGLLVNTSFNVRGEPIVCTPDDAYRCFRQTEMDVLVLGNYMIVKSGVNVLSGSI
nr:carbamoyltransferase [uncultured Draconibacterium sp.]